MTWLSMFCVGACACSVFEHVQSPLETGLPHIRTVSLETGLPHNRTTDSPLILERVLDVRISVNSSSAGFL